MAITRFIERPVRMTVDTVTSHHPHRQVRGMQRCARSAGQHGVDLHRGHVGCTDAGGQEHGTTVGPDSKETWDRIEQLLSGLREVVSYHHQGGESPRPASTQLPGHRRADRTAPRLDQPESRTVNRSAVPMPSTSVASPRFTAIARAPAESTWARSSPSGTLAKVFTYGTL